MSKPPKPRCGGQWTDARFKGFIMSALRNASKRWGPRSAAMAKARVRRGWYKCALCCEEVPATSWATYKSGNKKGNPKKVKNNQMDHIEAVIDPSVGFVSWDEVIRRMFVEEQGWQCICHSCHEKVTTEEREIRKQRK